MNWDDLQEKAWVAMPDTYKQAPPRIYTVGILFSNTSWRQQLSEFDFLWLKGCSKTPVQGLRDNFLEHFPGTEIDLWFRNETLAFDTTIELLDHYNDNLIIMQAIQSQSTAHSPAAFLPIGYPFSIKISPQKAFHRQSHTQPRAGSLRLRNMSEPKGQFRNSGTLINQVKEEKTPTLRYQTPMSGSIFIPKRVLNHDPSPKSDAEVRPIDHFIRMIMNQESPEILEAGVAKSMRVLETLKNALSQFETSSPDTVARFNDMLTFAEQSTRARTVLGVVGNTGAGKSSLINALLDEERLVPTNCMRACTTVVTKISWNDSEERGSKYRAEIEFIRRDEWEQELRILMKEFLAEVRTISREAPYNNSDTGIAWIKLHAVYPNIPKETLKTCSVEHLMSDKSVLDVLNQTKHIHKEHADSFYTEVQKYIDSKEKLTSNKVQNIEKRMGMMPPSQMECWPLIKVVRIYTKAEALSTGAVIVDLPGVHDANAARSAVADRYMKKCTGLWIVSPITRAVDDRAAKILLGEPFKRQLKYDGNYSNVTFICSKTDDICVMEAIDGLGLKSSMAILEGRQSNYKKDMEAVQGQLDELHRTIIDEANKGLGGWKDLKGGYENCEVVYKPSQKPSSKRKNGSLNKKSRKRYYGKGRRFDGGYTSSDSDKSSDLEGEVQSEPDTDSDQASWKPLTGANIKRKIDEMRNTKKRAQQQKETVARKIIHIKSKKEALEGQITGVEADMRAMCITKRNENSKIVIKQDFAEGIRDLDKEDAAGEDEECFRPKLEARDYDAVVKSLPVFCVSSRAYQKMCGRFKNDMKISGFKTLEDTEMPQLQAHCKKLTEAKRIMTCREFLLRFCQLLTSLSLWASSNNAGLNMTDKDEHEQLDCLQKLLSELEEGLTQAITESVQVFEKELQDQIFRRFPNLVKKAIDAAPNIVSKWGSPTAEGGLRFNTYQAICRRGGEFTSSTAGYRNFNAELTAPIMIKLATSWECVFQNRLPKAVDAYTQNTQKLLYNFYEMVEERASQNNVRLPNIAILKNSILNYEQMIQTLGAHLKVIMAKSRKEANRDFVPAIAAVMGIVYNVCANERGDNAFMRMKYHMMEYVNRNRHSMFMNATKRVKGHLKQTSTRLEKKMWNTTDKVFASLSADFIQALHSAQFSKNTTPEEDKAMKKIKNLLHNIDPQFERIANGQC